MKKFLWLVLAFLTLFSFCSCDTTDTIRPSTRAIVISTTPSTTASATTARILPTKVQSQKADFVPIDQVGSFDPSIITNDLIQQCDLGEVSAASLPYWTGYILESKIFINNKNNDAWRKYIPGQDYFVENEIKYLSENGFNCARALYSFSFFSDPNDPYSINKSELEQLDELIAWGMTYNIHIMISNTGLPGKWNTSIDEENVGRNSELFQSKDMQELYRAYWNMLAKRYASIPSGVLSFELAVETSSLDGDMQVYTEVLGPIAKDIWKYNDRRIVVAPSVWGKVPEQLAAMGCCISLHQHIYQVNTQNMKDWYGIEQKDAYWPMEFFPSAANRESGSITLTSESDFKKGTITVSYGYFNRQARIEADGKTIFKPEENEQPVYKPGSYSADIPAGTKEIKVIPTDEISFLKIDINQDSSSSIELVAQNCENMGRLPSILIHDDGTTENVDEPKRSLNANYFTSEFLQKFIECAEKNKVSFIMTEVGTDTADLSPEEYIAYHETWLEAFRKNNIGWMYNCVHNILAPKDLMWLNDKNSSFKEFSEAGFAKYQVNDDVMNMLKRFRQPE